MVTVTSNNQDETQECVATFAAGCFWGVQLAFQRLHGVIDTTVGYAQGTVENPSYKQVRTGKTGHAEAIRIVYNVHEISYSQLLDKFWSIHDPTTLNRQKNDVGTQYRSGIYVHSDDQRKEALASFAQRQKHLLKPIVTEVEAAAESFWSAEEYHQQYLAKGGQCADKGCQDRIRCYG
jgi:peptide-methionine (S)-S-oxide reductase/lysine-specific demethylase/histidyl-hydroxylase NO66|uniref:peptide-methionine (S)-S-oxide reductase n=1 Tax=Globisporangium ultimum (strain ATCC 200006 / CBS 805.95 / DAOM BR144) TaxID=431595 RepID=K3XBP8_GLOUD